MAIANEDQISTIKSAFGDRAKAGSYELSDGSVIDYGGPNAKPAEASGGGSSDQSSSVDRKKTPPSWDGPEDARRDKGAGKYPNYYVHKTRSGHVFMMDDSEGAEHLTIQHRTGTMIQVDASGKLNITANKGQYNIVFGENRIMVTGAQDITVQGAASLRVEGEYNINAKKVNISSQSDINLSGVNINTVARGNIDIQAKNRTEKIQGSIMQTAEGAQTIMAETGMTLGAKDGGTAIMAGTMMSLVSRFGTLMLKARAAIGIKADGLVGVEAKGAVTVLAGGALQMSGVGTCGLSSAGPMNIFGTPATLNMVPTIAPPALDGELMFTHIPAPPAIPDPAALVQQVSSTLA